MNCGIAERERATRAIWVPKAKSTVPRASALRGHSSVRKVSKCANVKCDK